MDIPVCLSWSGRELVFNAAPNSTVRDLQSFIETHTTIPSVEQITLFGPPFQNADRRSIISVLRGKRVFLYDRKSLSRSGSSRPTVPDVVLSPLHLSFPTRDSLSPSHGSLRELAEADDPLLQTLAEYERKFLLHVNMAEVFHTGGDERLAACSACVAEQGRVLEAMQAAQDNLRDNNATLAYKFGSLWSHIRGVHRKHTAMLDNFEHSLALTQQVQLHETLQDGDRKTLFDWLPADRLRQWWQQCSHVEGLIWQKAKALQNMFADTSAAVVQELNKRMPPTAETRVVPQSPGHAISEEATVVSSPLSVPASPSSGSPFVATAELQAEVAKAQNYRNRQQEIAAEVGANYRMVLEKVSITQNDHKNRVTGNTDSSDRSGSGATQSTIEMISSFDTLRQRHENTLLDEAQKNDTALLGLMRRCAASKTMAIKYLYRRLRCVAALQTRIREQAQRMSVVRETLSQQKGSMADLAHVEHMPAAYSAALVEVVQRRKYKRSFVAEAERTVEILAQLRDSETERRESFLKQHGQHLPRNFIPSLAEMPPHCELRVPQFDLDLPLVSVPLALSSSNSSSYSGGAASGVVSAPEAAAAAAAAAGDSTIASAIALEDKDEAERPLPAYATHSLFSNASGSGSGSGSGSASGSGTGSSASTDAERVVPLTSSGSLPPSQSASQSANSGGGGQLVLQGNREESVLLLEHTREAERLQMETENRLTTCIKERNKYESRCMQLEAEVASLKAELGAVRNRVQVAGSKLPAQLDNLDREPGPAATVQAAIVDTICVGLLRQNSVALFVPAPLLRSTTCRAMIAMRRSTTTSGRFQCHLNSLAQTTEQQRTGPAASPPDDSAIALPTEHSKAIAADVEVPCYLSPTSFQAAIALLRRSRAVQTAGDDGALSVGHSAPWPNHWPVQVVGRITAATPGVTTVEDNPYDLPVNSRFVCVEAEVLDCKSYVQQSNRGDGAGKTGTVGTRTDTINSTTTAGSPLPPLAGHKLLRPGAPAIAPSLGRVVMPVTPGTPGTSNSGESLMLSPDEEEQRICTTNAEPEPQEQREKENGLSTVCKSAVVDKSTMEKEDIDGSAVQLQPQPTEAKVEPNVQELDASTVEASELQLAPERLQAGSAESGAQP